MLLLRESTPGVTAFLFRPEVGSGLEEAAQTEREWSPRCERQKDRLVQSGYA